MLVASTYPLFTRNQQWTIRIRARCSGSSLPARPIKGVYNAALLLLGHPEHLLEYAAPFAPFERWESYAKLWRCTRPSAQIALPGQAAGVDFRGRQKRAGAAGSQRPSDDDFVADRRHALFRPVKNPLRDTITKFPTPSNATPTTWERCGC